jgi:glycosyltransferase involved in cell wall biosynthesis
LRIAVFAEYFPPRMGSDRRIYELMKRIAGKHEINFLLVPPFCELQGMLKKENYNIPKSSTFMHEDITTHRLEIPSTIRGLWRKSLKIAYILTMALLIPKTIKKLTETKPETIVLNYPSVHTGVLGFLAAKILRKNCIVDFNDLIAQYTIQLLKMNKRSFTGRIIIFMQDFIVKNSDMVIAPTNFIRNYALSIGIKSEKISVIPNGADMRIFNAEMESDYRLRFNLEDKKVCLYFGRLDGWAGVHILAEICNVFEQKWPDVRFLMVGDGTERIDFPRNVIMTKQIPHHELPKIITIADVILVPFPENEVSHAASPLKLFEAMAMRKPIVASSVSGISEIVKSGYNGLLVDSNRPEEWVEALETVLDSKPLQMKLGKNAEDSAKNYDWNVLASKFESTLSNLD